MYSALIIEDDNTVQAYLKRILVVKFGFTVYQAFNGIEGLKKLDESTPDVILLDHSMPFMDGVEFLQTLKKQNKYKNIPIFVISASNESDTIKEMLNLGVVDYILKPIDPEMTYERIKKAIIHLKKKG